MWQSCCVSKALCSWRRHPSPLALTIFLNPLHEPRGKGFDQDLPLRTRLLQRLSPSTHCPVVSLCVCFTICEVILAGRKSCPFQIHPARVTTGHSNPRGTSAIIGPLQFCVGVEPSEISLFCVNMSLTIGIVPVLFLQSFPGQTVSYKTSGTLALTSLSSPISVMFPKPQIKELWCRCIHWSWFPHDLLISADAGFPSVCLNIINE